MCKSSSFVVTTKTTMLNCRLIVCLSIAAVTYGLPNDKPFLSVWNAPTAGCNRYGLNLSAFDFVINEGGEFWGNSSIIYYRFGRFPYYNNGTAINGGLPQLGNVTPNDIAIQKLIKESVPNPDFNGIGVFDWETWRAAFEWNFDSLKIYQTKSEELVKQKHPDWNSTQVYEEAAREFDLGAERFMGGTLNIARRLRPRGYWGYYAYPMCSGTVNNGTRCDSTSTKSNDRLAYLYGGSTGYFPRIYLGQSVVSDPWVTAAIKESLRVRSLYGAPWTEIMPYSLYLLGAKGPFYSEHDLDVTVKQSADAGAGGIVFWGSSATVKTKQMCLDLINYVDTILGPYIGNLTNFVEHCSSTLCSNHGRCVVPDIAKINYRALPKREPGDYKDYICQCYYKWSGTHCDKPTENTTEMDKEFFNIFWLENILTCIFMPLVILYESIVKLF